MKKSSDNININKEKEKKNKNEKIIKKQLSGWFLLVLLEVLYIYFLNLLIIDIVAKK